MPVSRLNALSKSHSELEGPQSTRGLTRDDEFRLLVLGLGFKVECALFLNNDAADL
jgi:hypothetical protein